MKEKQKICDWLSAIGVKLPNEFSLEKDTIEEFGDGVLLCEIVG